EGRRPEYSGVSLRDCVLRARDGPGRELARWRGDLLFTHQGVSGPCALGVSRAVALGIERGPVTPDGDGAPAASAGSLIERRTAARSGEGRRSVRAIVGEWLPERLAPEALSRAGIAPDTPLHQLPRKGRGQLVEILKRWGLGQVRAVPLEMGEVTA